ncbi:MAG: hypothetical protein EXQ52_10500 [Bryobacterales bacterium]|nr:hypothetical protein [Bryobacterales bacterium]
MQQPGSRVLLYACTIFLSAFLLFQVQPMIAKMILPWFGGTVAVWTICMLFFQVILLAGYGYAAWSIRYLTPRMQSGVHVSLLVLSAVLLPIAPNPAWKPAGGDDPTFRILALLLVCIGLPYFLLSTTGPLLQAWYARRGAVPYRLFALSNFGSMLALLTYPALVEPYFASHTQARGWSAIYGVFVVLCGAVAIRDGVGRRAEPVRKASKIGIPVLWIALPACASALLLAVTTHLSQNVAPIPFLWVAPLTLYLLSFIICFEKEKWYSRSWFMRLLAVAFGGMCFSMAKEYENTNIFVLIPLFAAGLFLACMVCHGEMVRLRPAPEHLTSFYLMCSLGGALGGVFVGLVSPHAFNTYMELPIAMTACAVLVLVVLWRDPSTELHNGGNVFAWVMLAALTLGLAGALAFEEWQVVHETRLIVRNFYGGLRVTDSGDGAEAQRVLNHGTINHGAQFLDPVRRKLPITYYGKKSGVALAILESGRGGHQRVGVIGLGTGTLAAYGRLGDAYHYYEINPLVVQIANTEFTYLKDTAAKVDIAMGDARISLERESDQHFDVIVIDAFSGDSIPIHLLTKEAFIQYFRHTKREGAVVVHVSNKWLDLVPVVRQAANDFGKSAVLVDTDDEEDEGVFGATWVVLVDPAELYRKPSLKVGGTLLGTAKNFRTWTDEYSNLFRILKR